MRCSAPDTLIDGYPSSSVTFGFYDEPATVTLEFASLAELKLKVEVDGGGNQECAGYVTADGAKAYFGGFSLVKLEAVPQPGYVFSHWQGRGTAFIADDHDDPTDERSLESETSPITNDEIWITMRDQDGLASRDITAVFREKTATLTIYVDDPTTGDDNHDTHGNQGAPGHTFWKFNGECVPSHLQPYAGTEYGFYPTTEPVSVNELYQKSFFTVPGEVRFDLDHTFTDSREYTISHSNLIAGLEFTRSIYVQTNLDDNASVTYDSLKYNCTDAAIEAATAAGITLPNAYGECSTTFFHSFAGNCPGVLGENLNP